MIIDRLVRKTLWRIRKYANEEDFKAGKAFAVSEFEGNVLLKEGIQALHNLLVGVAETSFAQANAYLGVGDSATGEDDDQTGLQAATNKVYVACEAGYPTYAAQVTTWRAIFTSAVGNFAWAEFTVASGNSDAADNLNRKVSAQGTKTAGQTWTLDLAITWS